MRLGGGDVYPGIDIRHPGAMLQCVHQIINFFDSDRLKKISTIHNNIFGFFVMHAHLRVCISEKGPAGSIDRAFAQSVVGELIGGFNCFQKGFADMRRQLSPFTDYDAVSTMFSDDFFQFFSHHVQSFVPGRFSPVARTAFADPDHGRLDPLIVIKRADSGCTPWAQAALHAGHMRISLDPLDLTIFDQYPDRTAYGTHKT